MTPKLESNFGTEFGVKDSPNFTPNNWVSNPWSFKLASAANGVKVCAAVRSAFITTKVRHCRGTHVRPMFCLSLVTPKCGPFPYVFFSVSDFKFAFPEEH